MVCKARSHCAFFLISTAIHLIAANGLYRFQWKCSHCATTTTSPVPVQSNVRKNKSQLQIAQCERTLISERLTMDCFTGNPILPPPRPIASSCSVSNQSLNNVKLKFGRNVCFSFVLICMKLLGYIFQMYKTLLFEIARASSCFSHKVNEIYNER